MRAIIHKWPLVLDISISWGQYFSLSSFIFLYDGNTSQSFVTDSFLDNPVNNDKAFSTGILEVYW